MSGPMGSRRRRPAAGARRRARGGRAGPRGRWSGMAHVHGLPTAEGKDFRGSLAPACSASCGRSGRSSLLVVVLAVVSVVVPVIGPKILGNATNIIFAGVVGQQLPAGVTKEQVDRRLRAQRPEPARRHALAA